MTSYVALDAFRGISLEDSYVLDVHAGPGTLVLRLEFVLTTDHPEYRPPRPDHDEVYFPRRGVITFPGVRRLEWSRQSVLRPSVDATGEVDWGNIDALTFEGSHYHLEGDFGAVDLSSDEPTLHLDAPDD